MEVIDFEGAYEKHKKQILSHARSGYVPDLEPEDIASELTVCLWRACTSYVPGKGKFEAYWWSLWLNRKADLIRSYNAEKRVHPIPVETLPERMFDEVYVPVAPFGSPLQVRVWTDIAAGYGPKEVQARNSLSSRKYYALLASWRTEAVRKMLLST